MNVIVCPGSIQTINDAKQLFGESRVVAGVFREPIHLTDLNEDEANFAQEYFQEQGKKTIIDS